MDTFTQRQELEDQDMAIFETTHGAKPTTPPARDRTSASGGATNQSPPISFEIAQAQGSNFMGLSDECFGSHGHNYENGAHTTWPLPDTYFLPWTVPTMFTSMPPDSFLNLPLYSGVHPEYSVFQPVMPNFGSFVTDTLPTPFQGAPPNAPAILAPNPSQHRGAGATFRSHVAKLLVRCEHPGCNKEFRRVGDCRRHMRKHNPVKAYSCVVDECRMKFYRLDKLRDHARDGHNIVL
ncbi:hypothetical protein PTNB73_01554 [Pyrenophora teres f. teres]|uniref:C2H2-type domain-containing protein n=1 Tax=Pyrenophora teres f. teres (strain 0-1) TaxID=861557 RepID=E3RYA1_PYRTT|nr:hypothetical protein PTT_14484 [Pyrenophora teres f. teres 0-1]KAE8872403.1 hypothetical protein PTNB73_01554 [Pyrenophora teres f. teres]